ncbi:hypothetical protein COBT_003080 [Conglomerata obtusa]
MLKKTKRDIINEKLDFNANIYNCVIDEIIKIKNIPNEFFWLYLFEIHNEKLNYFIYTIVSVKLNYFGCFNEIDDIFSCNEKSALKQMEIPKEYNMIRIKKNNII